MLSALDISVPAQSVMLGITALKNLAARDDNDPIYAQIEKESWEGRSGIRTLLGEIRERVQRLETWTKYTLENFSAQGRPRELSVLVLLVNLEKLYFDATGEHPKRKVHVVGSEAYGQFYDFANAVMNPLVQAGILKMVPSDNLIRRVISMANSRQGAVSDLPQIICF